MGERLVMNFHGLGQPHPWVEPDEQCYWCREDDFRSLLDDVPRVVERLRTRVEITFDDGNRSDVTIAAPALRERGLTASFFVCAGRIGAPGYLDASDLRHLTSGGMTIGSHGWDHVDWRKLRDDGALDREINQARDAISEAVGRPIDSVAIPFGSYDRRVWRVVTKAFSVVYTSDGGLAPRSGRVVPRETYTTQWGSDALQRLASHKPLVNTMRQSLAMAYKRHRAPLHR